MDNREIKDFMVKLNEENALKKQLDELSKDTLAKYIMKSADKIGHHNFWGGVTSDIMNKEYHFQKAANRKQGINLAVKKLAKEDVDQLDELSKKTLKSYIHRAMDNRDENQKRAEKLGKLAIDLNNSIGSSYNSQERKFRTRFRKNEDPRVLYDKSRELSSELNHRRYMADKEVTNRKEGIGLALRKLAKEDVEGLNELSKETLKSYIKTALDGKHSSLANHDMLKNIKETDNHLEFKDLVSLYEAYHSIFK